MTPPVTSPSPQIRFLILYCVWGFLTNIIKYWAFLHMLSSCFNQAATTAHWQLQINGFYFYLNLTINSLELSCVCTQTCDPSFAEFSILKNPGN